MPEIKIIHGDCMEYMATLPDKAFELAIVDPPYGIEALTGRETNHGRGKLKHRAFNLGEVKFGQWDFPPTEEYFTELFRISENQIIWGGNYFNLPPTRGFTVWDKCQPWPNFSQVEFAWASFDCPSKLFKFDNRISGKIHPTQKPVALYQWLLKNYAKQGDKILDTHLGSGSSAIAADIMGFDFVGIEIDEDYYKAALDRFNRHKQQLTLEL